MAEGLYKMALAGSAGTDDQHRGAFVEVAPSGEVMHKRAVQLRQTIELEGIQGLGGPEGGAAQPLGVLLLLTVSGMPIIPTCGI